MFTQRGESKPFYRFALFMSFIITFLSSFLGLSPINIPECRTGEFTTLMYHHVREYDHLDNAARNISVSPKEFKEQIKFLYDNDYSIITSRDIQSGTVPCKSVMITFDDGYHDVFTEAFPIMKQYDFAGIIGLIPAKIDESDYMTGEHIRYLQKSGWELANHTWHHTNLSDISREHLPYQIEQSKRDLEKWFNTKIDIFMYPKGRYTYYTLELIKNTGHLYAFTTQTGKTQLTDGEVSLELKRFEIPPNMTLERFGELFEPILEK